jgi:ubiquinone/menaquinone biosynthesis C-methylase UbiE
MVYDSQWASAYDDVHGTRFAEAAVTAGVLADLHAAAVTQDGAPGPVLELGIGTGRIALPLAALGLDVHGVDSSPDMIAVLRAKPGGEAVTIHEGNFAEVGEVVDGQFPMIFVIFNTLFELMSQDEQLRCISGAARRLSRNGVLVIEALAPEATRLEQSLVLQSLDDKSVVLRANLHDPITQQVTAQDITIRADGVSLRPWSIRYASVAEIDLMAKLADLRLVERWGGWHREPFTAASTRHVSVYGRRDP